MISIPGWDHSFCFYIIVWGPVIAVVFVLLLYSDRQVSLVSHGNRTVTGVPSWERWVRMSLPDK